MEEVKNLEICQEFVDSAVDCFRGFYESIILNNRSIAHLRGSQGRS